MGFGEGDQTGGAGSVVERAVADIVAIHRLADAEMIPVSGIYDIFVRPFAAGQDADDVARRLALDLVVEGDRGLHAERNGLEALLLGGGGEGGEVLARRGHELLGRLVGQPAVRSEEHTSELQSLMRRSYA